MITCMKMKSFILEYASKIIFYDVNIACYQFHCLLSQSDSPLQWHRRLGHPGITKLRQALPWISVSSFQCESCQLGKHFRSTYPRLDSIPSHNIFELIHCDV